MGKRRHCWRGRSRWIWFAALITLGALAYVGYNWYLRIIYPLPYREVIAGAAETYRIDPYLLAGMIQVESHFNPQAISSKGAVGLMQIMPETAAWIQQMRGGNGGRSGGGRVASSPADWRQLLMDPKANIDLGSWYLRELLDEFGQNEVAALAAYNGGRGNVRVWLDKGLWTGLQEDVEGIPFSETREYVRRVMASRAWYKKLYGDIADNGFFPEGKRRPASNKT